MRAAILTAYNEPLVIEEVDRVGHRSTRRARAHRRQWRLPLRPELRQGQRAAAAAGHPRPRGRGHRARGRQRRVTGSRSATGSSSSFTPACGNCFFCLRDQSQLCETDGLPTSMVPKGTRPDGSNVDRHERPRHLRRRDDRRRVDAGEGRDGPAGRAARAHRLRHHDRCRRRAQHRAGRSRVRPSRSSAAAASASR